MKKKTKTKRRLKLGDEACQHWTFALREQSRRLRDPRGQRSKEVNWFKPAKDDQSSVFVVTRPKLLCKVATSRTETSSSEQLYILKKKNVIVMFTSTKNPTTSCTQPEKNTTNQLVSSKREKSVIQTGCMLVAHKNRQSIMGNRQKPEAAQTDREATCLQTAAQLREVHYGRAAGMRQSACEVEHQRYMRW